MGKKNIDKTWRDIIREIEKDPDVLWHYITALRGPDVGVDSDVKVVFTCPLRGRCIQALGVEEFLRFVKEEGDVVQVFTLLLRRRRELNHYIQHVISVWKDFYPSIARVLEDVFFEEKIKPKDGADQYVKLVNEWLEDENLFIVQI